MWAARFGTSRTQGQLQHGLQNPRPRRSLILISPSLTLALFHSARCTHMQGALHHKYPKGSCGERVVRPLAVVRWPGQWHHDPERRAKEWWQVRPEGGVPVLLGNISR